MSESTALEQPAEDSISADLASAFESYDEDAAERPDTVAEAEEVEGDALVDEAEEATDEAAEEAEQPAEVEALKAPDNWPAADKEMFSKMPKEAQEWALRRDKEMTADYTRKTTELADFRKAYEPVQQLFAPYMEQLRQSGQSPAQVIQGWASVDKALTEKPVETLQWLAQQYNVDLGAQQQSDEFIDPKVQSLEQQIRTLQSHITQREQYESQQRLGTVQQQLQAFAEEKSEAGELAHPYFDDVVDDMVRLAHVERQAGRNPEVKTLYETAIWANPGVREKVLAAQQSAAAKKAEAEAKAKAAQARRAAKSVSSSGGASPSSDLSLRAELESLMSS